MIGGPNSSHVFDQALQRDLNEDVSSGIRRAIGNGNQLSERTIAVIDVCSVADGRT